MLKTDNVYFGAKCVAICDHKCENAWGANSRPKHYFNEGDYDDFYYYSDNEITTAPRDPGTYEGGHGKPMHPTTHNKWCVRECERCTVIEKDGPLEVFDFSTRIYNQPFNHGLTNTKKVLE